MRLRIVALLTILWPLIEQRSDTLVASTNSRRSKRSWENYNTSDVVFEDRQLSEVIGLPFPSGSIFSIFFEVAIHLFDYSNTLSQNILLDFPVTYAIPDNNKRGFATSLSDILGAIELKASSYGLDGAACVRRLVCEINAKPIKAGLLGDIINTIFSGELERGEKEYYWAQERGRRKRDCAAYKADCPLSLFNIQNILGGSTASNFVK